MPDTSFVLGHEKDGKRGPDSLPLLTSISILGVLSPRLSRPARWLVPVSVLLMGAVFVFALYPAVWQRRWRAWITPLRLFSAFPFEDQVRFFGTSHAVGALPWWYPAVWLPVVAEPVTLLACISGLTLLLVSLVRGRPVRSRRFDLSTRYGSVNLSFPVWLGLIVVVSWCGVLVMKPALYDEERHVLFLFPPLFLLGALGLDRLPSRLKVGIAALIVVVSLASYASWGRYAYVYKSPVIGDTRATTLCRPCGAAIS
jgi:hypothetical protein